MNEPNGHIRSCPRYPRYPQAEACISRFVRLAIGDSMMTSAKRRRTRKRVQDQEVGGRIGGPGASLAMKPVGRKGRVRIALREPEPRNGASRTWNWSRLAKRPRCRTMPLAARRVPSRSDGSCFGTNRKSAPTSAGSLVDPAGRGTHRWSPPLGTQTGMHAAGARR